jgi:3-hydroxyisobutyrate dehydrogenase
MSSIAFIGLGNMGAGMAANQAKTRAVTAFDLSAEAMKRAAALGVTPANSAIDAVRGAGTVITMLPAGAHVRALYAETVLEHAAPGTLLVDCSTIDVESARAVAGEARSRGFRAADAPVSGGAAAAEAGALTFMVGCDDADFAAVEDAVRPMAKAIVHAGQNGAGQAAKICNNMLLGISMLGVCEAFALAEKLGLDGERFFEIAGKSSGQCWSLTSYCPWPGPVASAPSNHDYAAGFATAMMLKDLNLAADAAAASGASAPLGMLARDVYRYLSEDGLGAKDFSIALLKLRGLQVSP